MHYLRYILLAITLICSLNADGLKKVSVQLEWKNTFEFAGFFVALEKGYYKKLGLDVKTKEWDYTIDTTQDVASGKSTFGLVRPSSLVDISNGVDIVYLMAIYQSNPLILLANKKSGIKSIRDLKHKRIMATKGHLSEASIISLLSSQHADTDDFQIIKHSFDVADLVNGKADAMVAYISNEPFLLKEAGGEPIMFNAKDYGFDFYNDIVIVNREYLDNNPKVVKDFRKATIKGYEYAFSHIDETVDLILKKYNTLNKSKEALLYEAKELKKLAYYKTDKFGKLDKDKLDTIYNAYKLLGFAKKDLDISKIIYKNILASNSLTNKEKKYLQEKSSLNLCIDPNWPPFDKIDEHGKYIGISADYIKLIEDKLSLKLNIQKTANWQESQQLAKENKCDIVTSMLKTPSRQEYINFTSPYIVFPLVAATKTDVSFINGLEDLTNKKLGITTGYAFAELARKRYPTLRILEFENVDDGLNAVSSGEIYAFIDTLPSIVYNIQLNQIDNLKISGKIYDKWELRFGVKKGDKTLLDILEKTNKTITQKQKQDILNRWISVKYDNVVDYALIKKIVASAIGILILILAWSWKISSKNRQLQKAQEEIEKKNKELNILATTDKLTGIFNRLKLDRLLEQELLRSKRYKSTFAIAILDVDFFKNVNDTYGHQVGDMVLQQMAKIIDKTTRDTDFVGRWGGEEFLIICIEINADDILKLMQRVRENIKNHFFANQTHISASFGVTLYKDNDNIETILKRADEALYKAKETGRDKIVSEF